jgi:hypothetical protein
MTQTHGQTNTQHKGKTGTHGQTKSQTKVLPNIAENYTTIKQISNSYPGLYTGHQLLKLVF